MNGKDSMKQAPDSQVVPPYEPPCVETVLTAEELEREVLYAGALTVT